MPLSPPPPGASRNCDWTIPGQRLSRNVHDVTFETLSQRARRGPFGVWMQAVCPCDATVPFARQVHSAHADEQAEPSASATATPMRGGFMDPF